MHSVLAYVRSAIDPYSKGLDGNSYIGKAIARGSLVIIEQLVVINANVNFVPKNVNYSLCVASSKGYQDIFDYLFPLTEPQLQ